MGWTQNQREQHADQLNGLAESIERFQQRLLETIADVVLTQREMADANALDGELLRVGCMLRYLAIKTTAARLDDAVPRFIVEIARS